MTILITGATGFLGGALTRRLCKDGYQIRASGRDQVQGAQLAALGAEFIPADLRDAEAVHSLCEGVNVIIHAGALSSLWGKRELFWACNVTGTRHIVEGALKHQVSRLVHISSPSVYFDFQDAENLDEDAPLPHRFVNEYTASKHAAEGVVLEGCEQGLQALILRPRALFGPGDTAIFPRILRALASKRLKIIGSGQNLADLTYIDNAVDACLLAMTAPITQSGRIYNITDGDPTPLWPLLNQIAHELGYPTPTRRVPLRVARFAARLLESIHRLVCPQREPIFTEYSVGILGCSLTLDISRARHELGYQPQVKSREGIHHFLQWWIEQELSHSNSAPSEDHSR